MPGHFKQVLSISSSCSCMYFLFCPRQFVSSILVSCSCSLVVTIQILLLLDTQKLSCCTWDEWDVYKAFVFRTDEFVLKFWKNLRWHVVSQHWFCWKLNARNFESHQMWEVETFFLHTESSAPKFARRSLRSILTAWLLELSTFWTLFFPTWVIENEVTRIGSKRTLTLGRGDASVAGYEIMLIPVFQSFFSECFYATAWIKWIDVARWCHFQTQVFFSYGFPCMGRIHQFCVSVQCWTWQPSVAHWFAAYFPCVSSSGHTRVQPLAFLHLNYVNSISVGECFCMKFSFYLSSAFRFLLGFMGSTGGEKNVCPSWTWVESAFTPVSWRASISISLFFIRCTIFCLPKTWRIPPSRFKVAI